MMDNLKKYVIDTSLTTTFISILSALLWLIGTLYLFFFSKAIPIELKGLILLAIPLYFPFYILTRKLMDIRIFSFPFQLLLAPYYLIRQFIFASSMEDISSNMNLVIIENGNENSINLIQKISGIKNHNIRTLVEQIGEEKIEIFFYMLDEYIWKYHVSNIEMYKNKLTRWESSCSYSSHQEYIDDSKTGSNYHHVPLKLSKKEVVIIEYSRKWFTRKHLPPERNLSFSIIDSMLTSR